MIRTTARPLRVGAAVVGIAGTLTLAGCASATTSGSGTSDENAASTSGSSDASGGGAYKDGTYTAEGSYQTPESVETISVTVTLKDDVVTDVSINGSPTRAESQQYQAQFVGGISDAVVGKNIDTLSVSRVAGSSLTSGGFNKAIDEIKSEAAA
ncbi:hypothetical protein [Microbacterium sp.]|uniref:FMN-binding protein n=1 Tax=Microbacterium sp. TaxID=51671 RepID=UPI00092BE16A|nr:hypothetical protein [Microbacterium sp.]MBN9189473.1 hypothetical protein [Microbacterium sp.]MBN9191832.1 hypothetical protein [Microbacterium sp.]OJU72134.1 MAG: hypothetical protein BGO04_01785 [Microbacterium sp. 70-38]